MHKTSKLFWPMLVTPKNAVVKNVELISKSQKLMTELGLIRPTENGTYQILPIAQRAIDKCVKLVDEHMQSIDGQKISLPVLTAASLWQKSGRLNGDVTEFFMLHDRHGKNFLLSPTHEEAITSMLAAISPVSYRQFPLRLYQMGPKFRDELKARFGLIRAKEFYMKDLYSFDRTITEALDTYNLVVHTYETLLKKLQVPFVKVEADSGIMGGSKSHEFHFLTAAGEDRILHCNTCGYALNKEVQRELINNNTNTCTRCQNVVMNEMRGIEVAHTFLLEDKYTTPFKANFLNEKGKPMPLLMGCYGIGITRLVAATLETLSTENELRWPHLLAPYEICVIGPKQGSKEQNVGDVLENELCHGLSEVCGSDEILHDDRKSLTIGKRLMDAKRMGHPFIVVIGNKILEEPALVELHANNEKWELTVNEIITKVLQYKKQIWKTTEVEHLNNEEFLAKKSC